MAVTRWTGGVPDHIHAMDRHFMAYVVALPSNVLKAAFLLQIRCASVYILDPDTTIYIFAYFFVLGMNLFE